MQAPKKENVVYDAKITMIRGGNDTREVKKWIWVSIEFINMILYLLTTKVPNHSS